MSALLCRVGGDGGQKKRSLGNKGEGTNGETKEEKRVYGGLENEERQYAHRIQMKARME